MIHTELKEATCQGNIHINTFRCHKKTKAAISLLRTVSLILLRVSFPARFMWKSGSDTQQAAVKLVDFQWLPQGLTRKVKVC